MAPLVDVWFQISEGEQPFVQRCELHQASPWQQERSQSRALKEGGPILGPDVLTHEASHLVYEHQTLSSLPVKIYAKV